MSEEPAGSGIYSLHTSPPSRLHAEQYLKAFGWKGYGHGLRANSLAVPLQLPPASKQGLGSQVEAWWTRLLDTRLASLEVGTQPEKTATGTSQGLYARFVRANTKSRRDSASKRKKRVVRGAIERPMYECSLQR
ncbi:uncharacterized protein T551_01385 [Pneumocystis jirovecii RU7]|uniref:G-patch domain-containing protein n=1 Tax=Pneumocystis jirovecii (strain RU7) TaxID=1408657 RepID=A0A0W4ZSF8_PNEJ7|nr:uncharacterized protein T551_01385 [Pneumocystis jirovecii RU7]KTW31313.1 hypothetical protein T551_01385 [Pneumocystis jirovecii RU7]